MAVDMFWCGTVRAYVRPLEQVEASGYEVAVCTHGRVGNARNRHFVRLLELQGFRGPAREAAGFAFARVLEQVQNFPVQNLHWVPVSKGGTGAVVDDGPSIDTWRELVQADLKSLADKGWDVA